MKGKLIIFLALTLAGYGTVERIYFEEHGKYSENIFEEITIPVEELGFGESDKRPEIVEISVNKIGSKNKNSSV